MTMKYCTYGILYAEMHGISQNFAEFRKISQSKCCIIPQNFAKFCVLHQKFRIPPDVKIRLPWTPYLHHGGGAGNTNNPQRYELSGSAQKEWGNSAKHPALLDVHPCLTKIWLGTVNLTTLQPQRRS
jgi:hypothetical protein